MSSAPSPPHRLIPIGKESVACGRSLPDMNIIFVATAGHETGHGSMAFLLREKAPRPDPRITWTHYCEIEMI